MVSPDARPAAPDLDAIRARYERNSHRQPGDDWHDPDDLADIAALVAEVERLRAESEEFKRGIRGVVEAFHKALEGDNDDD